MTYLFGEQEVWHMVLGLLLANICLWAAVGLSFTKHYDRIMGRICGCKACKQDRRTS